MDVGTLQPLIAKLLLTVQAITGYPAAPKPPEVNFVPHAWFEEHACTGTGRCAVLAFLPPGHTIYLDDRLDPLQDLAAQSILFHELVHYAQAESGAFTMLPVCLAWHEKEREAYVAQLRFLQQQNAGLDVYERLGAHAPLEPCPE
jgi:hypothetical protein